MSASENYLEFKRHLNELQSKRRITVSVSAAVARAQNLPESAEVNVPKLVARVAQHNGIELSPKEVRKARTLVRRELQAAHL